VNDLRDRFSIGLERFDVERGQILRRVRALAAAAGEGRTDEIRLALRHLAAELREHFAFEEAWMAAEGCPGARSHARQHAALVARFVAARDEAATGTVASPAAVELARAVEEHVRTQDLKAGRFAAARENLRLLAEAKPGERPTLTPIPGAALAVDRGEEPPGRGE
jgi:hemerythrin-like metal-binding protein